jgi:hypothetical protein
MIRDYDSTDLPEIIELHKRQGFDYPLPDLSSPLVLIHKVREIDGHVVAACFLRITAETYLLCEGSPVVKGRAIEELQPAVDRAAFEKGLSEYVCVLPPEIAEQFGPVLERIGWERARSWPLYQRSVDAIGTGTSGQRLQSGE